MATRRTRIKGIANIPQRRKTVTTVADEECSDAPPKLGEEATKSSLCEDKNVANDAKLRSDATSPAAAKSDEAANEVDKLQSTLPKLLPKEEEMCKPPLIRRRFVKPVLTNLMNRKSKQQKVKNDDANSGESNGGETMTVSKILSPGVVRADEQETAIKPVQMKSPKQVNFTLNETAIIPGNIEELSGQDEGGSSNQNVSTTLLGIRKLPTNFTLDIKSGSDSEYSSVSQSPTKLINRSRIKAVPRFGQRRTSYSASESEDDSRRIGNRNRNDSVCSVASGIQDSQNGAELSLQKKEFSSVIQRKCKRTEQSRKLAEARREFQLKFGDSKPDKQKLTMIDLIFYNPTTNPMSQKKRRNLSTDDSKEVVEDKPIEENVDDPVLSDEENELPAPQIKIGPSGEIIVDEKSLVIENKEVKKGREELQKSEIVDGDFDTSYGVYKRVKRSKDWTQAETIRFYKALNTIGTDFTLMCDLFPKRSRRELKMKFKKEERMNRGLIDRAVMHPKSFDLTELKHEVEVEQREQAEKEKQKVKNNEVKKEVLVKKVKTSRFARDCAIESSINNKKFNKRQKVLGDTDASVDLSKGIGSVLDDAKKQQNSDSESSDSVLDEMFYAAKRPGRTSKLKRKRKSVLEGKAKKSKKTLVEEDKTDMEPGSFMIVSTKGNSGEPVYKFYMVTPDEDKEPFNMASNKLNGLVKKLPKDHLNNKDGINLTNILTISEQKNNFIFEEGNMNILEERNITIPAEETAPLLEENNISSEKNNILSEENIIPKARNKINILADENIICKKKVNSSLQAEENNATNAIEGKHGKTNLGKKEDIVDVNNVKDKVENLSTGKSVIINGHNNIPTSGNKKSMPEEQHHVVSSNITILNEEKLDSNKNTEESNFTNIKPNTPVETNSTITSDMLTIEKARACIPLISPNCEIVIKDDAILLPFHS